MASLKPIWERTLDEYEKCILKGDVNGARVMRALLLEKLNARIPNNLARIDCGFCGNSLAECECPNTL